MESNHQDVELSMDKNQPRGSFNNENEKVLFEQLKALINNEDSKEFSKFLLSNPEAAFLQDADGNTLLHLAADHSHLSALKALLDAGADPNATNTDHQIPLHTVVDGGDGCHCSSCNEKNVNCTKMLIEANSKIDEKDYGGDTALGNSAFCLMPDCARVLWEHGADLNSKNDRKEEVGMIVSKFIPQEVQKWLRKEITTYEEDDDFVQLNFRVLLRASGENEKETTFLSYMNKGGRKAREKLLLEPLIQTYLYLKWEAVGILFLLLRLAYLGLVLLYTCFIFTVFLYKCPYEVTLDIDTDDTPDPLSATTPGLVPVPTIRYRQKYYNNLLPSPTEASRLLEENTEDDSNNCKATIWIYIMSSVMVVFVICMVLNELYEMVYHGLKKYMSIGLNYGWWIMIITVTLNILPVYMDIIGSWQYPVAAFGVFLSWGMFLSQLARHPKMGVYVEMLGRVIMEFTNFAITYIALFVGFACGFVVLFPDNGMFEVEYGFLPFVKSLLIMNGETDYETLFDKEENPRVSDLGYSIGAHILFVGFIVVVTIVLMNLLLGLAVSDIQKLQNTAELSKTQRLVEQIDLLETVFHSAWMPNSFKGWYKRRCSIQTQCIKYSSPKYPISPNEGFSPLYPGSLPETLNDQFTEYLSCGQCTKVKNQTEEEPTLRDLQKEIVGLTDQINKLSKTCEGLVHLLKIKNGETT